MNRDELCAIAQRFIASGALSLKQEPPKLPHKPRTEPRRRRAKLGSITVDGVVWFFEFNPPNIIVIRQKWQTKRHQITLESLAAAALSHGATTFPIPDAATPGQQAA